MDDLQFRRTLYADPKNQDPEITAAKAESSKQQFAQDIEHLERKIESALHIPVPDDLYNKLILRQTLASHRQQKRKTRVHLALAASVAFAFGLTLNFMQFSSAYAGIDDYALAHVYHEQDSYDNNALTRVSLTSLNAKMASFNGSFNNIVGELLTADYCRFDGIKSLHLVFQGESSPVNVFIVPNDFDLINSKAFSDVDLQGVAQSFGRQSMIIVADKQEPLNQWKNNLSNNIQWSI